MANKKNNKKEKMFSTKTKMDNSIEVTVNKSPAETVVGKILIWAIAVCTFLGIVLSFIFLILKAAGVF